MGKTFLNQTIQQHLREDKHLFIPFIMAGDGGLDRLAKDILFLQKCDVTAIEVGIPFSDPIADGPTIQTAGKRALDHGTTLEQVLQTLKSFKEKRTVPILIMSYINPIYMYGIERFAADCVTAGVQGVIIPDIPLEEESMIKHFLNTYHIAHIRLAALTSSLERSTDIANKSDSFLYAVTMTGTTGGKITINKTLQTYIQQLKQVSPVPVLAGFGVSTAEHARQFNKLCDGVIVGSQIVKDLHEERYEAIRQLIQQSIS